MKTQTTILTSLVAIALVGAAVVVRATERSPRAGKRAERLAQLGVTDDQKAQAKELFQKYRPTVGPLIKDYIEQRRALREAIHADPIDEAAIRQQSAKVAALGADLAVQRAHIAHDLRAVLTTDQLAKLKDWQVDLDAKIDQFLEQRAKRAAGE